MGKVVISDFLLQLGFDGKEVNKGLDAVEKRLKGMGKAQTAQQKAILANEKRINRTFALRDLFGRKASRRNKKDLTTSKARLKIERQITASQRGRKGGGSGGYAGRGFGRSGGVGLTATGLGGLMGGLFGLSQAINGLKGAMHQQIDAERARVGVKGVGQALAQDNNGIVKGFGMTQKEFNKDSETYLKSIVKMYGVELSAATETYRAVLGASIQPLKEGVLQAGDLKDLMDGVAAGAAAFKMNSEDQKLMWLGITQAMQKGKVQAEEITRQIGQRNPLAIQALLHSTEKWAKANGMIAKDSKFTHKQMYSMMREGKLLANDIMPQWGREMKKIADSMTGGDYVSFLKDSLGGSIQVYKAAMSLFWDDVFSQDAFKPMKEFMDMLSDMVDSAEWFSDMAGAYFGNVVYEITALFDPLVKTNEEMKKWYDGLSDAQKAAKAQDIANQVHGWFVAIKDFGSGVKEAFTTISDFAKSVHNTLKPLLDFFGMGLELTDDSPAKLLGKFVVYAWSIVKAFSLISSIVGGLSAIFATAAGAMTAAFAPVIAAITLASGLVKSFKDGDGGKKVMEALGVSLPDWMYYTSLDQWTDKDKEEKERATSYPALIPDYNQSLMDRYNNGTQYLNSEVLVKVESNDDKLRVFTEEIVNGVNAQENTLDMSVRRRQ